MHLPSLSAFSSSSVRRRIRIFVLGLTLTLISASWFILWHCHHSMSSMLEYLHKPVLPIRIKVSSAHMFAADYYELTIPCKTRDTTPRTLPCEFSSHQFEDTEASALWYCGAHGSKPVQPPHPNIPTIVSSAESDVNHPQLKDPAYMGLFNYKMTYRHNSDVPIYYKPFDIRLETVAPPGFKERSASVSFVHSKCNSVNGREDLVSSLMKANVPIEAAGTCLNNVAQTSRPNKTHEFLTHRVCSCIENSNTVDYVTEKVWDGLQNGCVPVYYGAPNAVSDFLPSSDSVIMVDKYDSKGLVDEINRVLTDEAVFNRYMAWRSRPLDQLSPGYRKLLSLSEVDERCRMCQFLHEKRNRLRYW
ncbi:hypothetical protein BJ741DRAFT_599539 [Chytriomyces cf. hyalinus JEL632]|nr:hypothetical protein BJ741DRAFT_599539 [Chytriomyces cf. hyalinus JEL632]